MKALILNILFTLSFIFLMTSNPIQAQDYCAESNRIRSDESLGHARFYASHYYQQACECEKGVSSAERGQQLEAGMGINKNNYNQFKPASAKALPAVSGCKVGGTGGAANPITNAEKYQLINGETLNVLNNISLSSDNERLKSLVSNLNENQAQIDMFKQFATSQEDIEQINFIGSIAQGAEIVSGLFGNRNNQDGNNDQEPAYISVEEQYRDDVFQETYTLYEDMIKIPYLEKMKHELQVFAYSEQGNLNGIEESSQAFNQFLDEYDVRFKTQKEKLIIKSIDPQGSPAENLAYFESLSEQKQALIVSDRLYFLNLNSIIFGKEYAVDYSNDEFILDLDDPRNQALGNLGASQSIKETVYYINYYIKLAQTIQQNGGDPWNFIQIADSYFNNYYQAGNYPENMDPKQFWPQYIPAQIYMKGMIELDAFDKESYHKTLSQFFGKPPSSEYSSGYGGNLAEMSIDELSLLYERSLDNLKDGFDRKMHRFVMQSIWPDKWNSYIDVLSKYHEMRYLRLMELKFTGQYDAYKDYLDDMHKSILTFMDHDNKKNAWKMRREWDYEEASNYRTLKLLNLWLEILLEENEIAYKEGNQRAFNEAYERTLNVQSWHFRMQDKILQNGDFSHKYIDMQTYLTENSSTYMISLDRDYVTLGVKDRNGTWAYSSVGGNMDSKTYLYRFLFYHKIQQGLTEDQIFNDLFDDYNIQSIKSAVEEFDRTSNELPDRLRTRLENLTESNLSNIMGKSTYGI